MAPSNRTNRAGAMSRKSGVSRNMASGPACEDAIDWLREERSVLGGITCGAIRSVDNRSARASLSKGGNHVTVAQIAGDCYPTGSFARVRDRWISGSFPPPLPPCMTFSPESHATDKAHMPQGWATNS